MEISAVSCLRRFLSPQLYFDLTDGRFQKDFAVCRRLLDVNVTHFGKTLFSVFIFCFPAAAAVF